MATIIGTEGADTIDEATEGGSTAVGSTIEALGGDDRIVGLQKQPSSGGPTPATITDWIDGGAGIDTYALSGLYGSWSLTTERLSVRPGGIAEWIAQFVDVEQFDIVATRHGTAALGAGDDRIDVSAVAYANGSYQMGGGDDWLAVARGEITAALGDGDDRLVIDHSYDAARTYLNAEFTGSLATGYGGVYRRSDGASASAEITFSGVEHFTLRTGAGGDTLVTGDGNDVIEAGAGDDRITAGRGTNRVDGGAGIDGLSIDFSDQTAAITVDLRIAEGAQQTGGAGAVTGFEGFLGAVVGTSRADTFIEGNHSFDAQFSTGRGNDLVRISRGTDTVDMGAGSDRLVLDHAYNNARTYMTVALSGDVASGYAGTYYRSDGASAFATVAFTGVEHFTLLMGGGNDNLVTGDGDDVIAAGAGNDVISVGRGDDTVDGGDGTDTLSIDFSDEAVGVAVDLRIAGGAQQTGGTGAISGIESFAGVVIGSAFDDHFIEGVFGYDAQFSTGAGDDIVQLSRGADTVDMGAGSDRLVLDHSYNNARTYMSVALGGDLASGYAGTYYRSDGASAFANVAFTGVEHFTLLTGGGNDNLVTGDGDDVIAAGAGNDVIAAGRGTNTIDGGDGIDTLSIDFSDGRRGVTLDLTRAGAQQRTGAGSVTGIESFAGAVIGTAANDVFIEGIYAYDAEFSTGDGDDLVQVSRGTDTVDMGAGSDRLVLDHSYNNARTRLTTDLVGDLATGYSGTYYRSDGASASATVNFSGVEHFTIRAGGGGDTLVTGDGEDILDGGAGADTISAGGGVDQLFGGEGDDILDGGAGDDRMVGGVGNDRYTADSIRDKIVERPDEGIDTVTASVTFKLARAIENLTLSGDGAIDGTGNREANTIIGNAADNVLRGDRGDDVLTGNGGNDTLNGGFGADRMTGGAGDDTYFVDNAGDLVIESAGGGIDTVRTTIDHVLAANVENLVLTGGARSGTGNALANRIDGTGRADTISGLGGDDLLFGGAGRDTILGGDGNDTIVGGADQDVLTGGAGADTFRFGAGELAASLNLADTITDFSQAQRDLIHLAAIDAVAGTPARDRFAFIGDAAFSGTAGELRYQAIGGDTIVSADTNGDGTGDMFLRLSGTIALTAADFVI